MLFSAVIILLTSRLVIDADRSGRAGAAGSAVSATP